MESRWRYNIAFFGMVGSNWRLCARSLEDPGIVVVEVQGPPNEKFQLFDVSDPGQLPIALNLPTPRRGRFPYGEAVEPD